MTISPGSQPAWLAGTASWFRVTAAAVAMLAICLLVVERSTSAFSGQTANTGNSLSMGSVVLTDDDSDSALFTVSNLEPGQSETRRMTVSYTSADPTATVRLYGTSAVDDLSPYLDLKVQRGDNGDTCSGLGWAALTTIFDATRPTASTGTLQTFTTNHNAYLNAVDTGWTPLSWDQNRIFVITLTVRDENAAQNKTATPAFTWEVRST